MAPALRAFRHGDGGLALFNGAKEESAPLIDLVGSRDKEAVVMKGGHVSLVAGGNAIKRLWPKLDTWLGVRST